MKKLFSLILSLALIVSLSVVSFSAADYGFDDSSLTTEAVYLENLDTGTVVYEKNAGEKMYPASTTKVMTYIIVAENVPDFENTYVEVTASALVDLDPESSVMGLSYHIGEKVSVLDLLYGLMLPSGNDAALVLADYVGHGVDGFVDLMNRKAAQLGCSDTHFTSPHGLHDERHYSTARDMATITKYALTKSYFKEITSSANHYVVYPASSGMTDGGDEMDYLLTTNYLIDPSQEGGRYYYPYATGVKTGYTDEAGRCLVSTAEKDGYEYLCVALGAPYSFVEDVNYAMLDSAEIYDWAFSNLSYTTVFDSSDAVRNVPVEFVWGDRNTDLVPASAVTALLPNGYDESLITTKIDCVDYVSAPVEAGEKVGTLTVYYDDALIGSTAIVTSENVERDETNYLAHRLIGIIYNNFVIFLFVGIFLILLIVAVSVTRRRRRIEREKRRYR